VFEYEGRLPFGVHRSLAIQPVRGRGYCLRALLQRTGRGEQIDTDRQHGLLACLHALPFPACQPQDL
jgi:hypothetical protein